MRTLPDELLTGPFTRQRALALGVSSRMLEGDRFVRVFPRVWRATDHILSPAELVTAAALALPAHVQLTGITRIQQLGLDFGPRTPIRFVVAGDLHLALAGVFLHRTKKLPPIDDVGVTPAAAFLAYAARARVVDAIKVGDWMVSAGHLAIENVRALALTEPWRDGAHEALWVLDHLDGRSRSVKESETRAVLVFAGLPRPDVNGAVDLGDDATAIGDLVYRRWGLVVEYEGGHHQQDRTQYVSDLDRYALLRAHKVRYVQVTHEKLSHAKTLVGEVFRELVAAGYDGPPPVFGPNWRRLFQRVSIVIGPRRDRIAHSGARGAVK